MGAVDIGLLIAVVGCFVGLADKIMSHRNLIILNL